VDSRFRYGQLPRVSRLSLSMLQRSYNFCIVAGLLIFPPKKEKRCEQKTQRLYPIQELAFGAAALTVLSCGVPVATVAKADIGTRVCTSSHRIVLTCSVASVCSASGLRGCYVVAKVSGVCLLPRVGLGTARSLHSPQEFCEEN
jgi:hypothetical protein